MSRAHGRVLLAAVKGLWSRIDTSLIFASILFMPFALPFKYWGSHALLAVGVYIHVFRQSREGR